MKQTIEIEDTVTLLSRVQGIKAIVLGGSRQEDGTLTGRGSA